MLAPQLRSSVSSSVRRCSANNLSTLPLRACPNSIIRAGTAYGQSRNFWGCRRGVDYASHIDPMFNRFTRYRTLKTRAKLLDKLRRQERWDRDGSKPFFSSRHIRLASHWNGNGPPRWRRHNENDDPKSREDQDNAEENGYELSKREKEWKEQMEKMRKRIEKDPYEAMFGKRFEPFWSPLVPSWMREEMGLQGWPKGKESARVKPSSSAAPTTAHLDEDPTSQASTQPTTSPRPEQQPQGKKDIEPDNNDGPPNGQLTNYSYTSSTSWDSWTRKARREEWDSITGQTRRFEYDPISNRMVQVAAPPPADLADSEQPLNPSAIENPGEASVSSASDNSIAPNATSSPETTAVDIPVKTVANVRKSIPVPTITADTPSKTPSYFPSLLNTSIARETPKTPGALQDTDQELELLTADEIRASVGRSRHGHDVAETAQAGQDGAYAQRNGQADPHRRKWDRAEMISRLDAKMLEIKGKMSDRDNVQPKNGSELVAAQPRHIMPTDRPEALQSSLERMQSKELSEIEEPDDSAAHESTGDRIARRTSNVPKGWNVQADVLQSDRVHRTRDIGPKQRLQVPRWIDDMNARKADYDAKQIKEKATDNEQTVRLQKANAMLEAEVQEQKFRMQAHETRYAHKIRSLKAEIETAYKQSNANAQMQVDRIRNLETELERAQKAAGDFTAVPKYVSNEERYVQKIRDLRKELDTAFKQSSANAEMQMDRITKLERDLQKAQKSSASEAEMSSGERQRYVQKIRALRKELDNAFKQSSISAEMQVERIHALEKEVDGTRKANGKPKEQGEAVEAIRGEGDFCANITKYAKDDSKWYKRKAFTPSIAVEPNKSATEVNEQKRMDDVLVREVKDIYEKRYGTIDQYHRQHSGGFAQPLQPRPLTTTQDQTESEAKLGKALEDYDKQQTYRFPNGKFENDIAFQEREAHDAQALTSPDLTAKLGHVIKEGLPVVETSTAAESGHDDSSDIISATLDGPVSSHQGESDTASAKTTEEGLQWEEPPMYKILAYDSGNDMFSTATTSSNFTRKEKPISIQQALSQLYQPSRFVAHFAGLQKEGYQVVHAMKDLLVFRKVRAFPEPTRVETEQPSVSQNYGLPKAGEARRGQEINSRTNTAPAINPIDGTARLPPGEPSTGSFASPTGFVGDRWEAIEHEDGERSASDGVADRQRSHDDDIDIVHYPRIKREERVFTGSRLGNRSREHERRRKRHHHEPSQEQKREMRTKWNGYRSRMRWAVGVGLGAGALAYGIGAAAERKERKEMERWQEILEGKRTRWE